MDINDFQNKIYELPKSPSDFKLICQILEVEYKTTKILVEPLLLLNNSLKFDLNSAIENLTDEIYLDIINNFNYLELKNKELQKIEYIDKIDIDLVRSLKEQTLCDNFYESIPSSFINTIIEVEFNLKQSVNNLIDLPSDIVSNITKSIKEIKQTLLSSILSNYFYILNPFNIYKDFLSSNDVSGIVTRLAKIESCLLNPNGCNKTRSDFINKESNLLWSEYYKETFLLSNKGTLDLDKLISNETKISQINEILTRMERFTDRS